MNLSKSLYIRGLQCTKSLWLKNYKKDVLAPPNEQMKAIFKTGDKVGAKACELFPGGKEVPFQGTTFEEKIALTKKWIDEGVKNIYEATFEFDSVLVMVDIFHINDDGSVEIYEVKSSTWNSEKKIKEIQKYIEDAAIQHYVVKGCGFEIKKTSIVLLNSDYIRGDKLEIDQLFSIVDVTDEVLQLQDEIPSHLHIFAKVLEDETNEPSVDIGWHCKNPYECDAFEHCWRTDKKIPEYSVFDIFPLTKNSKALQLYHQGIVEVDNIPDNFEMTENQALTVDAWKTQHTNIDNSEIKNFLDTLTYPIFHFDFETCQDAIPQYEGTKPFQQIPFQYSLHIDHGDNKKPIHKEFLADEKNGDPRMELVKQLVEDIPQNVTVMAYHTDFEKDRLEELAEQFPEYSEHLLNIADNLVDLEIPFKEKHYYVPQMKGKSSIKVVMPALVPEMENRYKELELIQNGGDAMNAFPELIHKKREERDRLRCALLKYCELDTLSMVEILKKLKEDVR